MHCFCAMTGLCVALTCLLTVRGLKYIETDRHGSGEIRTLENLKETSNHVRLTRRSARQLGPRTRREIKTLVGALQTNAEKLENLTAGMEFLVQSEREKQRGDTDIIQRLDGIDPLLVSMFVVLVDVAFSTSTRIATNQHEMLDVSRFFLNNTKTAADRDILQDKLSSVYEWYLKHNASSCTGIRDAGLTQSGNNNIWVAVTTEISKQLNVYCDQATDGGGWLVIQRRQDGSVDFFRNWTDYQAGFGDVNGEFWIGNDNLHLLTNVRQELRVDLMDFKGNTAFAKYSSFAVGPSSDNYRLTVSGYSGTAGDSMANHNGMEFSTINRDNDMVSNNCAQMYECGWWYNNCYEANLNNGQYEKTAKVDYHTANWFRWKSSYEALKRIEMKIRPLK